MKNATQIALASSDGNPVLRSRETLIAVENLTKRYGAEGGVVALDDISLTVDDGDFVSIVGPSGCGKSTLLKIMAGLLSHTKGRITLGGASIREPSPDVGVVFQAPVLLPWRTVLENVLFPLEIRTGQPKKYREKAMELIEMAGLKGFEDRYPHELSGGMQQRAGIVRALVQDPKVLLMDEPFGALDAMTREQMNIELLRIWSKYKKTVVFVTHSIPESVLLSDKVVAMTPRPGRVAEIISIDLPRPRDLSIINTEAFGNYASRIRKLLNAKEDVTG